METDMYDKVTKLNTIAKRKAYSKVNEGVLVEHKAAYHRGNAFADFKAPVAAFAPKLRNGKLRRRDTGKTGCGSIITNFARGTSARSR
jgi:hypothetical protein